jgi:hypothetical protein
VEHQPHVLLLSRRARAILQLQAPALLSNLIFSNTYVLQLNTGWVDEWAYRDWLGDSQAIKTTGGLQLTRALNLMAPPRITSCCGMICLTATSMAARIP